MLHLGVEFLGKGVQIGVRCGLISSIEYQTASNTYLNALAEKLNAQMQHFIKKSVVLYYKGIHYLEQ